MSSIGFRNLRKVPTLGSRINNLIAEYQKFASNQVTIEDSDFKTIHRSTQSLLKYHELTVQSKVKPATTQFYMPYEPDWKNVVLMLNLDQLGRYAIDSSGFGNRGKIAGAGYYPQRIMDDGIDVGFGENSEYLYFDGAYTFVYVEDSPQLQAKKVGSSICFTFRLYLMADSWAPCDPNDESKPRYIFAKCDDSNQQNGYAAAMTVDGRIKFTWVRDGTRNTIQTTADSLSSAHPGFDLDGYSPTGFNAEEVSELQELGLTTNAIAAFGVVITVEAAAGFDKYGFDNGFEVDGADQLTIYIDRSFITGTNIPDIATYTESTVEHLDLFVGNEKDIPDDIDDPVALDAGISLPDENLRLRVGAAYPFSGTKQTWYKFRGGLQHFRIYKEKLLDYWDIEFLFLNKLTISRFPFGQIALAGYTMILETAAGCCGFNSDGFSGIGFDTGFRPTPISRTLTETVNVGH